MTYNKPEVLKLESPLSAIQGMHKGLPFVLDLNTRENTATPAAYESDE